MQKQTRFGAIVLAASVLSALTFRLMLVEPPPPPSPESAAPPPAPSPSVAEERETFATRMPTGKGVSVVASNGQYRGNHLLVAVPDQFQEIHYLPGSDPRAVKYLAEMQEAHEKINFDDTPSDADLGGISPRNATSTQGKRIGLSPKKK